MTRRSYCFVVMPFGLKPHPESGPSIDFDRIFEQSLRPAIEAAGLEPLRDDMTAVGGMVQKSLFDALMLCEYVVVDLTAVNANVFYELGIRHAVRPASTVAISARPDAMPFDVANLRAVRYVLDEQHYLDESSAETLQQGVTSALKEAQRNAGEEGYTDSPLYQLVEGWRPPLPASMKTDDFAGEVERDQELRAKLAGLRRSAHLDEDGLRDGRAAMRRLEAELPEGPAREPALAMDVLLTHRALEDWDEMVRVVESLPGPLRVRSTPQEQLALALNRRAEATGTEEDAGRALLVLDALVEEGRATSETFGLIGRVHKGAWKRAGSDRQRKTALAKAVEAYAEGHRRDMTDPYPGINACTLATIRGSRTDVALVERLLPVVVYGTEVQMERFRPTYWMYATMLEASVLRDDRVGAQEWMDRAIDAAEDRWAPRTTAQTLRDLHTAYVAADAAQAAWVAGLADELDGASP